jgi:pyruvate-formate lyase
VSEENKRVLHEVCPWWRGQTVQDRCYGMFTDEQKGLLESGIIKAEGNMTSGDAHLAVNFPLVLEKGLDGMRHKVDDPLHSRNRRNVYRSAGRHCSADRWRSSFYCTYGGKRLTGNPNRFN